MTSTPTFTTAPDTDTDIAVTFPTDGTGRDTAWLTVDSLYAVAITATSDGLTITVHPTGHEDTTVLGALSIDREDAFTYFRPGCPSL